MLDEFALRITIQVTICLHSQSEGCENQQPKDKFDMTESTVLKFFKFLANKVVSIDNSICNKNGYRIPQPGDARNDFLVVCTDMKTIGHDLRNSAYSELNKYGH